MLNECKEYEQYTFSLDSDKPDLLENLKAERIGYIPIGYNLTGLPRTLTILARKTLFPLDNQPLDKMNTDELKKHIKKTISSLKNWCEYISDEKEIEESNLTGWLPKYLDMLSQTTRTTERNKKVLNNVKEKLKNKEKQFSGSVFEEKANNDINAITFQKIIAEALSLGPLSRYYLVCKSDSLAQLKYKKADKEENLNDDQKDIVLKSIAYIRLQQYIEEKTQTIPIKNDFVIFRNADVANWVCYKLKKTSRNHKKLQSECLDHIFYKEDDSDKEHNLFEKSYLYGKKKQGQNIVKLGLNSEWAKAFDPYIISKADFNDEYPNGYLDFHEKKENYVFFSDNGSGSSLLEQKNKIYE